MMKHLFSALVLFAVLFGTLCAQEPAYVTFKVTVNGYDEPFGSPIDEPHMLLLENDLTEVFNDAAPPIIDYPLDPESW